jgi:hypothetical protein
MRTYELKIETNDIDLVKEINEILLKSHDYKLTTTETVMDKLYPINLNEQT